MDELGRVGPVGPSREAKAAKLGELDKQIEPARGEYNCLRIAEAKAEAQQRVEAEITGLEPELGH